MTSRIRLLPTLLAVFALGAVGLVLERGAGAGDGPGGAAAPPPLPTTWVYDVRVVRVDAAAPGTVEAAPAWQPTGATGAATKAPWADLLTGLKARGKTTILLDQRVTALGNEKAEIRQERKRPVLMVRNRQDGPGGKTELYDSSYVESSTSADLTSSMLYGLSYRIEVRWEEDPAGDGSGPIGSARWSGGHVNLPAGETLVLSHRQQRSGAAGPQELEIHVLVTGWAVPPK